MMRLPNCSYTVYEMGEALTVGGGDQQTAEDTRVATLELKQVSKPADT